MQNRELSWLRFNERVLEEASYKPNQPLERLRFISIFTSNLDEFFMIRVGSLTDYMHYATGYFDNKTGMTAQEQLSAIFQHAASLCVLKDRYFQSVTDELGRHDVFHLKVSDLDADECKAMEKYFEHNVKPLLSPQIIDDRHPFPHLENKRLYIAVTLENKSKPLYGLISVPASLERIIFLGGKCRYLLLEDMICHFASTAFKPYKVLEKTVLSVTRNADISVEGAGVMDEEVDFRQFMQKLLKKRPRLAPVRLELQHAAPKGLTAFFCDRLKLNEDQVYLSASPLDFSYTTRLEDRLRKEGWDSLYLPVFIPNDAEYEQKKADLMKQAQRKDCLFSYPYESFAPFLDMVRQAAEDPSVISIKITLYRLDQQSKLAESLIRAAENGKEVIVLMELRARFDEANNIEWSHRLEEAGCRVIYGPEEYKVHSKICLITKRELGRIHYITQIGTGNYNEKTVKQYTDLSLITANQEIGRDAVDFFNSLLIGSFDTDYTHLWAAPNSFKANILQCIEGEQRKAECGEDGKIVFKFNSLTDKEIITKLIEASMSGVKITLIVRGICCLIPHISGYTDNITILSVVGRFLEHSRIYCFGAGDKKTVYLSSADLMTRNTERRVEIACPVLDIDIKEHICDMLDTLIADNTKAWEQFADGRYILRYAPSDMVINAQEIFIQRSKTRGEDALVGSRPGAREPEYRPYVAVFKAIWNALFPKQDIVINKNEPYGSH